MRQLTKIHKSNKPNILRLSLVNCKLMIMFIVKIESLYFPISYISRHLVLMTSMHLKLRYISKRIEPLGLEDAKTWKFCNFKMDVHKLNVTASQRWLRVYDKER